jgi:DNA-binding protein H-NS
MLIGVHVKVDLEQMSIDELWDLYVRLGPILLKKLEEEREKVSRRLDELNATALMPTTRKAGSKAKYRNPANPSETWSGRGRRPRWVVRLLALGRSLDDCKI